MLFFVDFFGSLAVFSWLSRAELNELMIGLFQLETQMKYAKFQTGVWQKATSYAWKTFSDPKIRRQFRVLSVLGRSALPMNKLKEVFHPFNNISS